MNSSHLKQCVQGFTVFDFLREIIGKVPDLRCAVATGEDHSISKKRKVVDGNENASDDESKISRKHEIGHVTSCGKGIVVGRGLIIGSGSRLGRFDLGHKGEGWVLGGSGGGIGLRDDEEEFDGAEAAVALVGFDWLGEGEERRLKWKLVRFWEEEEEDEGERGKF
ncbi:hypothetical protein PTKIN_Ptkin08bG0091000 [Pterospermum kingtungense]